MTLPQNVKDAMDIDYAPGELDRTAPERIWLQVDTNGDNNDRDEPWSGDDASWCAESIGGLEIQYVRADLLHAHLLNQEAEIDRLRSVHRWNTDKLGGSLMVCRDEHEKGEACDWETFVPIERVELAESRLAAANALLREAVEWNWLDEDAPQQAGVNAGNPSVMDDLYLKIQSHLQGAGDEA